MGRAHASGIALIQHFEAQLQRDVLAVEAAVTERWSNGLRFTLHVMCRTDLNS
jgi:hypothetical protein